MSCVINWFMLGTQLQSSWQYALGAGGRGVPGAALEFLGTYTMAETQRRALRLRRGHPRDLGVHRKRRALNWQEREK